MADNRKHTRVVNIRKEAYDVYIGRAGKGQDGYFGNPFRLKQGHDPGRDTGRIPRIFLQEAGERCGIQAQGS